MEGNQLDALLTPEFRGQVQTDTSVAAPVQTDQTGTTGQEGASPDVTVQEDGQGTQSTEVEMVPKSQYDELRAAFTKKSMENAQLKRQPQTQHQRQVEVYQEQDTSDNNPLRAIVRDLVAQEVAPIQYYQQELQIQAKVQALAENKEFEHVAPAFLEILEETPELFDIPNGIDMAYSAAKVAYLERASVAKAQATQAASSQVISQKQAITDTTPITRTQQQLSAEDQEAADIKASILGLGRRSSIF